MVTNSAKKGNFWFITEPNLIKKKNPTTHEVLLFQAKLSTRSSRILKKKKRIIKHGHLILATINSIKCNQLLSFVKMENEKEQTREGWRWNFSCKKYVSTIELSM